MRGSNKRFRALELLVNTQLLTVKEIEENLRLGHTKVAEIIRTGELKTVKIGRSRRSSTEWLGEFIQCLYAVSTYGTDLGLV